MSKPNYRVTLTFDPDRKVFLARAPELEHCSAEGASRGEAIGNLEQEIDAQLANMLSHGTAPPKSVDEEEFTGELTAKVSRTLHRDLAWQARSEGLEPQQLVGELLAAALEGRKQTHRGPRSGNRAPEQHHGNDNIGNRHDGGRPRQGFGGRGTQVLDDRATFIEYVRGLEQGGGQHQRGGGPGHSNRGGGGPGGGGGDNARRRGNRGGRGGNGGGGFRQNDQRNHGSHGGSNRPDGFSASPAPSTPAPNGNGPGSSSPAGNDDRGGNV